MPSIHAKHEFSLGCHLEQGNTYQELFCLKALRRLTQPADLLVIPWLDKERSLVEKSACQRKSVHKLACSRCQNWLFWLWNDSGNLHRQGKEHPVVWGIHHSGRTIIQTEGLSPRKAEERHPNSRQAACWVSDMGDDLSQPAPTLPNEWL